MKNDSNFKKKNYGKNYGQKKCKKNKFEKNF